MTNAGMKPTNRFSHAFSDALRVRDRSRTRPILRFVRGDLWIIGMIVLLGVAIFLFSVRDAIGKNSTPDGLVAIVSVDGKEMWRQSLDMQQPVRYTAVTPEGDFTVQVGNGQAFVTASDCKDQICVRTGILSQAGQSAVCLPLRAVLRVEYVSAFSQNEAQGNTGSASQTSDGGIDAVSK